MMTNKMKSTKANAAIRPPPNPAQENPTLTVITTRYLFVMIDHHPTNVWGGKITGQFISTFAIKLARTQSSTIVCIL
jgi:hypothetical protein